MFPPIFDAKVGSFAELEQYNFALSAERAADNNALEVELLIRVLSGTTDAIPASRRKTPASCSSGRQPAEYRSHHR